ncbi:bifunctional [glutamine synthetase] adenylyltransferase/[glutamine synthetase]-adenylyl-L-tyrosine phosphorylase [Bradyrhizobium sp. LHD-71]|uniref:bifunctional [glutamine synthetase] adenylyltransferase/[glutamine synthetase]-adenylyl-L-tyrosine phosphorylase n=1 Tax=Bradyrhizobium sp. LHD-71 TaxID=3072141 RepID=UPI00280C6876|nr:bifunctional [glutamine synthetase] adenylyltransferase/[glutamine synthetase]-adenylyl-L-tyrosine phosphorylase [Bradyrhizobium sp. LHD-71]MDQ8728584.1 bifunctional [glutamine synthetase] adenylyltransferase/[glutamine synthetase]-adenylyl-L-tyrosine phosphorylase [Bradyrhizobium sp. LHD-71]
MTLSAVGRADDQSLAARFVTGPRLFAPEEARQRFAGWLEDLPAVQRAAIEDACGKSPRALVILQSIAEASPYLFDLIRNDAERTLRVLGSDPDRRIAELIEGIRADMAKAADDAAAMQLLRRMKAEAALLIALCDIGGVWPVMRVTAALTDVAVTATQCSVRYLLAQEAARSRIVPTDRKAPEVGSGLIVLAMGKMGAGELNYSSDIDLIVFYDIEANSLKADIEPQPFFVRIAQGMSRLMQQRTADGYVFRVDLRLRPDPASTPAAVSTASALGYYEREGRTWERAAMIKAYPCAGDQKAGELLLGEIAPFVWRRYLDFAALADVHDMKRQMHAYKGHAEIAVEGHNLKQGRGGIREIEFFAQTQQLIAGGRHPELRTRRTLEALDRLAEGNWITADARDELTQAYEFLRTVEHRLQMVADEQTHTLPEEKEAVERFARFLGFADRDAFAEVLLAHLRCVQAHYSKLFEDERAASAASTLDFRRGADDPRVLEHIASLGFKQPAAVAETLKRWLEGDYRGLRSEPTREALQSLLPLLLGNLARAENPDGALVQFDDFLQDVQRGATLLTLLHQNPDLVSLIASIMGAAPRLGDMLAQQPRLMDGLVDPRFFGAMPRREEISQRLKVALADADSYEEFLDRLRLFGQESLFLIGSRILSGTVSAQLAGIAFADVAEGIVSTIHALVTDQFAQQHGKIKDQETAVIGMGRLGSREMTASSDLDLIFIYDFDHDNPDSDGARPLQGGQYFARLTQRLISAFTTRTNHGVLYDVDMRLRPSGRSGPVATRIDAFAQYQDFEAWTWEHMALTRARVVSASPAFREKIETVIRGVLTRPREKRIIANDVLEMRQAIAQEKGDADIWDIKHAAGGLIDIEFAAQYLQLVHASEQPSILDTSTMNVLDAAARLGVLQQEDADVLRPAMRLYQDLSQILRLCLNERFKPDSAGADLLRLLARAADVPDFSALEARLKETEAEVRRVFLKILEGA